MGGAKSRQHNFNQQNCSFDSYPVELKLSIFTLLPYQDIVNLLLVNKKNYDILISNWLSLKKIPCDKIYIQSSNCLLEQCSISLNHSNKMILRSKRAYTYDPCPNMITYYESKTKRNIHRRLMNLTCIRHFRYSYLAMRNRLDNDDDSILTSRSFAIKSIEEGAKQYLDFLLSKVNPESFYLHDEWRAIFHLSRLLPALISTFSHHGTTIDKLTICEMQVDSTTLEFIDMFDLKYLKFLRCDFENESTFSEITNAREIYVKTRETSLYEIRKLQLLLENWMIGNYPKLKSLCLEIYYQQQIYLFKRVLENVFQPVFEPFEPIIDPIIGFIQFGEMIYTRSDGRILIFNGDGEKLLFTCSSE